MIFPYNKRDIPSCAEGYIRAAFRDSLTDGRYCNKFRELLKEYIGCKHVILTNSGSAANLLAVATLMNAGRIQPGDKVITTAMCFPTTVAPLIQLGLIPFYIDVDADGNISLEGVESSYCERTKLIMYAHFLGNPAQSQAINMFASEHGISVIEDCCDALGSKDGGLHVGRLADLGTLSFYPAHHITTGEGGAVFTDDDRLAAIAESLCSWGRDCTCAPGQDGICGNRFRDYDHKYTYRFPGYNMKMTDLQGAIGVAEMDRVLEREQQRRAAYDKVSAAINKYCYVLKPMTKHAIPFAVAFLHPDRTELQKRLQAAGIQSRPLFAGDIRKHFSHEHGSDGILKNTDMMYKEGLFVSCAPYLIKENLLDSFINTLQGVLKWDM